MITTQHREGYYHVMDKRTRLWSAILPTYRMVLRLLLIVAIFSSLSLVQPRAAFATPMLQTSLCDGTQQLGAWQAADIGTASTLPGTTIVVGESVFVCGGGDQLWDTADGLRLVYQTAATPDFDLIARLDDFVNQHRYTKVGLSVRASTAANAAHFSVMATRQDGVRLQWRSSNGSGSADRGQAGPSNTIIPTWLRITRTGGVGGTFRAFYSTAANPTVSDWVQVGVDAPFAMPSTVLAGTFVSSRDATRLSSASFSNVRLSTPASPTATAVPPTNTSVPPTATAVPPTNTALPAATATSTPVATATSIPPTNTPPPLVCNGTQQLGAWQAADIGTASTLPGTTIVVGESVFVCGGGDQLWDTADGLRLVYQAADTPDFNLIARLDDFVNQHRYTKVGLSVRASTAANAAHFSVLATRQDGVRLQWRSSNGSGSADRGQAGPSNTVIPTWLRITRTGGVGGTFRAFYSTAANPTASDWVQVGVDAPFALPSTVLAGPFVSSRDATRLSSASFSNVRLSTPASPTTTAVPPTSTAIPAATSTPVATATSIPPTNTALPAATATSTPDPQASHPRLFFSASEIAAVRAKLAHPQSQAMWQPIRTLTDQHMNKPIPASSPSTYDPNQNLYTDYRAYGDLLVSFAFACVMTDLPADCNLAKQYMLTYATWTNWEKDDVRDLGLAHMLMGNAIAYDWLYTKLTPAERTTIRTAIGFHAERMHEASVSPMNTTWNNWWTSSYMQNHFSINHSGLGIAALALHGEDSRAQKWLDRVTERITRSTSIHNQIVDGSWHESTGYKDYLLSVLLPFTYNLERLHHLNLNPDPYLERNINFRAYNHLPNRSHVILTHGSFGWDWLAGSEQLFTMRYMAARTQNGMGEWLVREWERDMGRFANVWKTSWYVFEYLTYDPDLEPVAPTSAMLGQAWHLQDLDAVIWRTGWSNDDVIFSLKSGPFGGRAAFNNFINRQFPCNTSCQLNIAHDHADANNFNIAWGGTWLATENEGEWRLNASNYHNTILIDGQGQRSPHAFQYYRTPSAMVGSDGFIEAVANSPSFDYVAGNATRTYAVSGLQNFTRHVVFVRPGYFVMLDNLESTTSRSYTWISHFHQTASATRSGSWIRATNPNNRQLGIQVLAPASFNHTFGKHSGSLGKQYVQITPSSSSQNARIITLLTPATSTTWDSRPQGTLQADSGQGAVVRVTHANSAYDDVIYGYNVSNATTIGNYTLDGRVAVVSRDAGGNLAKLFVAHSTFLRQGSTDLVSGLLSGAEFEAAYSNGGTQVDVAGTFGGTVRLYAPAATSLTVNGTAQTFTRNGDSISFTP